MKWRRAGSPNQRGKAAEAAASHFLQQQGLAISQHNYRCRLGEIDIIAKHGPFLVFVEVRLRQNTHFGGGAESVTGRKQARLLAAARHFLAQHARQELPCRFDVIEVTQSPGGDWQFNWLQNAFQE